MGVQEGYQCKLYRNTATWDTPTWSEVDIARDVGLNMQRAEGDMSVRASEFKEFLLGQIDAGVDVELVWDPSDTNFDALLSAFLNNTAVELLILDGAVTTAGSEGLRATWAVAQFPRAEPLDDGAKTAMTIKPRYNGTNKPTWYTATS